MRWSIGGCVDRKRVTSWARNGLAIIMWLALTMSWDGASAVSYTHLTLPTICSV